MIESFVSLLDKNGANPKIIFDIGSRDCMQSIEFAKKYPNAKIFAFECNPQTLPQCRENIASWPAIKLIEGAVHK
jgi:FkbM family methyltransferase